MKSILLKNVKIVQAESSHHNSQSDILIVDGNIKSISKNLSPLDENTEIIQMDGLLVSSGWMDGSVSFGEPGYEERETLEQGSLTALRSGFTEIGLNMNTSPCGDSQSTIRFVQDKVQHMPIKLHPIANHTIKGKGEALCELFELKEEGAIAFGDYNHPISNDLLMKISLQYCDNIDALLLSFPLNEKIAAGGMVNEGVESVRLGLKASPALAEVLQVQRDISLLSYTGGRLHIPTISSKESLDLIKKAKKQGLNISCSVSVAHLCLNDQELRSFDSNTKINPPLRTEKDRKALIRGVKDGTIDFIVSDHRPMDIEEKKVAYNQSAYGSIGLESAFGALKAFTDLSTELIIEKFTSAPRSVFKLNKPLIQEGELADLTLFTEQDTYVFNRDQIMSSSNNSIFFNKELTGKSIAVIVGDKLIKRDDRIILS